ncbi:MAG: DUF418 domain-containing protein [Acidimicrobiales bacterium]
MHTADDPPVPLDVPARPVGAAQGVAPTSARPARQLGLDVARALAVLGMFLAHFGAAAADGHEGWASSVTRFVDGRAMPLFVLVSGAGVTFLLRATTRPVRRLAGRATVLLVLGLALEHTTGIAVILQFYALYFLLALVVRRWSDHALLAAAVAVTSVGAATRLLLIEHLPHGFQHVGSHSAQIGALRTLLRPDALLADLWFGGIYPVFPTFAFFLVGMWLGRQRLSSGRLQAGLVVGGLLLAVVGYGAGWSTQSRRQLPAAVEAAYGPFADLAVTADRNGVTIEELVEFAAVNSQESVDDFYAEMATPLGSTPADLRAQVATVSHDGHLRELARASGWDLLDSAGHSHMPAWMVGATGWALMVVGACLAFAGRFRRLAWPLAMAGQMALTLYVAHLLALRWPLHRWPYSLGPAAGVSIVGAGWVGVVGLCAVYRRRLAHGPLEAVLRRAGGPAG